MTSNVNAARDGGELPSQTLPNSSRPGATGTLYETVEQLPELTPQKTITESELVPAQGRDPVLDYVAIGLLVAAAVAVAWLAVVVRRRKT